MARRPKDDSTMFPYNDRSFEPPKTPEEHEHQMAVLAFDLVEHRLRTGTATSQEVCHFLSLSSSEGRLKQEKMKQETNLMEVKAENIKHSELIEELFKNAISAMTRYQGGSDDGDYEPPQFG